MPTSPTGVEDLVYQLRAGIENIIGVGPGWPISPKDFIKFSELTDDEITERFGNEAVDLLAFVFTQAG